MMMAPGTTEAVVSHNKLRIARITFLNRQLPYIYKIIDRLTKDIAARLEIREGQPGTQQQRDVESLRSIPGIGRSVLATLLTEAFDPLQRGD